MQTPPLLFHGLQFLQLLVYTVYCILKFNFGNKLTLFASAEGLFKIEINIVINKALNGDYGFDVTFYSKLSFSQNSVSKTVE